MKKLYGLTVAAMVMSACATTSTPDDGDALYFTGFNALEDGRVWHGGTGLVCPATLLAMPRTSEQEYGDRNDDASCRYTEGEAVATIYLTKSDYGLSDMFQSSAASIFQGPYGENIELDEEATQTCTLGGLLLAATVDARDGAYVFESAVFSSEQRVTLLQMSEIDGKFLKLRYTVEGAAPSEATNLCMRAAGEFRDIYTAIEPEPRT